jgi:hypothetical protein
MSDLGITKHMDGSAAKFLRFAGPDNLIIEVNGTEQTVTREFWRAIPIFEINKQDSKTVDGDIGVAHPLFVADQL